ncbi:MAG: acyl-CoA dehydrogenase [Gammaproteobacteria bacterium]|nr:acyl-CoA dehydrogenase [Gammaproteobacteria bacterium]MYK28879.1 acyl-CoA dehydrogenase [Gammaproteobacteria bacterium]
MIPRTIFSEDHELYRDAVRKFIEAEITPFHDRWEKDGVVPRELWIKAGRAGVLCSNVSEEYGGPGADFLYNVVLHEELAKAMATGPGFAIHSDMVATYIYRFGTEEQKRTWLPKMVSGEAIGALGLTEPGAGSDLKAIQTRAVRDGDDYVINGQKVFISNGQLCDLVVLACKTDPNAGARGMSFIIVESDRPGFARGKNLEKIGAKAQDTSELFFEDVRVPASNRIGEEGEGFKIAMTNLAHERITVAASAMAQIEAAIGWTCEYTLERKAFGQRIADFQNTQFTLAQLSAEASSLRVFIDECIRLATAGELDGVDAAKAKLLSTELLGRTADSCLQFFGGYGYMREYPIARLYTDCRVRRIAGGSTEVMKQIIGRELLDG